MRRLFAVDGLACAGCARGLERRLAAAPGVRAARVHYLTASALLDWTEETSPEVLADAVKKAGYRLVDRHRPDEVEAMLAAQGRKLGTRLAVAVASGMWSGALALVLYLGGLPPQAAWWVALAAGAFALPVVFYSGAGFLWMAWRSLKLGDPGMDLIVAAGSLAATALSAWALAAGRANVWFDTAVMLVSLLLAARLIDVMTRRSALKALRAMAEAAPEAAQRLTPQGPRRTPAAEIAVGDRVIVDAGETAAVDGVVVAGESLLNRAMLTGEPVPLAVAPGARIEAGAVNLSARLEIEVDRAFGDREIDHMGGAVALEIAEGGAEGGPAEAWAARLVRLIPLAAGLTILVGLALGRGMEMSLIQGLSLMVGVCPCALAIALPLVRLRTARLAAAAGARIREPAAFEALAHLRRIVFDKTGTLTEGTPQVVAVEPAPGVAEATLLTAAARAETGILHPIARAVIAHAGEIGPGGTRFDRGAEARDGQGALIRAETGRPGADGRARIRISRDGVELGQIVLADRLRPEAGAVLDRLRAEGLALEIATGDSAAPAQALGAGLGFDARDIHAGLTPRDKAALLRAGPRPVAFIGDGVNDGPALAAADCGLSIAAAHPAARQTAGVVIERGGIERLPGLVALSRRAAAIGRQNLTLAIAYNLCAIPAALAGLMRPEISAVAMAASSISILLNTLRLTGCDVAPPQAGPH